MNGEECKALRTRLNLTQQEFADKLGVCRALIVRGEKDIALLLLKRDSRSGQRRRKSSG